MSRKAMVVGVANHNGWAVLVTIASQGGEPRIVDRRRVELLDRGLPNQPYEHDTLSLSAPQAEELVRQVRESAGHCAERGLGRLRSDLGATGDLIAVAMREPVLPRMPDSVAEAHASYHVLARADSMLFHTALCAAATTLGIEVELIARGRELRRAAERMKTAPEPLDQWLQQLREQLGAPWQKDHREATARAIVSLSRHAALKLPPIVA